MMGEMLYEGRAAARALHRPASSGKKLPTPAMWPHGWRWATMPWCRERGRRGLRAYRKAQKLCASTPDIAYMPQVCLRVAQYETQYISRKRRWLSWLRRSRASSSAKKRGTETAQELAGRDGGRHPPTARERMSGNTKSLQML